MIRFLIPFFILVFAGYCPAWCRDIAPIITVDWLESNLDDPRMIVLDIRTPAQYQKGHIPGSVSVPLNVWAPKANGLELELPSDDALRAILSGAGINRTSKIVIVTRTETDFGRSDATRVAWTCAVAGLQNVAVLDGGFTKWAREKKTISTALPSVEPLDYTESINRSMVATKAYLLRKLKRLRLVDSRIPEEYFGITSKPGHIEGAVNMPTPWVFNADGTYKKTEELKAMASGVLGKSKSKKIVVYCGVGGYAATWWFVLTQVLGYRDVKVYDGSFEEWIQDPLAPVKTYAWN